jgi:hypothetical protein
MENAGSTVSVNTVTHISQSSPLNVLSPHVKIITLTPWRSPHLSQILTFILLPTGFRSFTVSHDPWESDNFHVAFPKGRCPVANARNIFVAKKDFTAYLAPLNQSIGLSGFMNHFFRRSISL